MPKPQFTDAGTLTPGPDCGISIPSIAPGGGGKGGGGGGRGVGAAEVTADFFFSLIPLSSCFAKEKQLSLKYTMLAQTNT